MKIQIVMELSSQFALFFIYFLDMEIQTTLNLLARAVCTFFKILRYAHSNRAKAFSTVWIFLNFSNITIQMMLKLLAGFAYSQGFVT